jgi:nitroreductase/dihydropteridine reductase
MDALLGAAALGIDACPMEGVDVKALGRVCLKSVTALAVVSLGYRKDSDFNAKLQSQGFLKKQLLLSYNQI